MNSLMNDSIHLFSTHLFCPPDAVEPALRDPEPLAEALQVRVSDFVDCALRGGVLDGGEGGLKVGKQEGNAPY